MTTTWKNGTEKAYKGYVAQLLISILGGLFITLITLSGGLEGLAIGTIIVAIISVLAYIYYVIGINEMKNAAANTSIAVGTNRLFIGAILTLVSTALGLIPAGQIILTIIILIIQIIGLIITWTGYSEIKNNAVNALAKEGGAKLSTSVLLTLIAAITAFIPIIGWLITLTLEILAIILAIKGWKALSNSSLE